MKPVWGDLNARVRGLGTRLLRQEDLVSLSLLPDLPALATALARRGFPLDQAATSPEEIELGIRRQITAYFRVLGRWAGGRTPVLSVLFNDEDRRSVRTILRRIGQADGAEASLASLLPTPALPERALQQLARQPSIGAVATLLTLWRHPYGPPLASAGTQAPDLLECEIRINQAFAKQALEGARLGGRRGLLLHYVRDLIDIENAYTALAEPIPEAFLEGGRRITRPVFRGAHPGDIARAFAGSSIAAVFSAAPAGRDTERAVLDALMSDLRRAALRFPLGPAPVIHFALRLRGELLDLQRIVWGVALGAPRPALVGPAGAGS